MIDLKLVTAFLLLDQLIVAPSVLGYTETGRNKGLKQLMSTILIQETAGSLS